MSIPIKIDPFLPELERIDREIRNMPQQARDLQEESLKLRRELRVLKELQPRQRNILRSQEIDRLLKGQPTRRTELEHDKKLYQEAEGCFQRMRHNASICADVEIITNNFVIRNIKSFSNETSIKFLIGTICPDTDISSKTILDTFWRRRPNGWGNLHHNMELYVNVISELIDASQPVLWIFSYHVILVAVTELLANEWITLFPQFETVQSKKEAIDAYVQLGLSAHSNDSFQFTCWLYQNAFVQGNLVLEIQSIDNDIVERQKDAELVRFKTKMLSKVEEHLEDRITMETIDGYSGTEFEQFVGSLFTLDGYQVGYTMTSNDKGIDVIAKRNGISIGIQCKRYSSSVGIDAVQEVYAGKSFYGLNKAIVITNNYFTQAAIDLAKATDVTLWDRKILEAKISLL